MSVVTDFRTYTADSIYATVPQFIQDQDAANSVTSDGNGPLYHFINSMASIVDQQINVLIRQNMGAGHGSGADGTTDTVNYDNAPNWSQVVDINRCPIYALPWLAQFVGVSIPLNTTLTYAEQIAKIKSRSSFQRGTTGILQQAIAAVVNSGTFITPLDASKIIVLENTKYTTTYVTDVNSMTILIPKKYLTSTTYQGLNSNGTTTYASIYASFPTYGAMNASGVPLLTNNYGNIIYRYRPAGINIYIGGY